MDLSEIIAALMAQPDRNAVVTALASGAQPIYQMVFDKGHDTGYAKKNTELRDAQAALDKASQQVGDMEKEVTRLKESQPEASKIHDQYKAEIARLDETHKAKVKELREEIGRERLTRAQADLKSKLTSADDKYGMQVLDPAYADVLTQHPDIVKRLKFNSDAKLEVLQAGKDIPLQVADGQDPLNLLAVELKAAANPRLIVSNADAGSGERGTEGTPGGASNQWTQIREKAKQDRAASTPATKSAAERMGLITGA